MMDYITNAKGTGVNIVRGFFFKDILIKTIFKTTVFFRIMN